METDTERVTTSIGMMTRVITKRVTATRCEDGVKTTRIILRPDWSRKTVGLLDWKNNSYGGYAPARPPEAAQPGPRDLEHELPPPPLECAQVLIGGHIVLLNQRTNMVMAAVHFEIR
jgi:hypothetical protein